MRTFTPTNTATLTPTFTFTVTCTGTFTSTFTLTATPTVTPSVTGTAQDTETSTPTLSLTATAVATTTDLVITDTMPYPNPFNPGTTNPLTVGFTTTRAATETSLLIYTSSYRFVLDYTDAGYRPAGPCYMQVPADMLLKMARGVYYAVIEAKPDRGAIVRSDIFKVVIIR